MAALGAIVALLATSCGGDSSVPTLSPLSTTAPTSGSPSATVTVGGRSFAPEAVTVAVGGTVTWLWESSGHNSVGSNWDSGVLNTGSSFRHTFSSVGSFGYRCAIHDFTGTVEGIAPGG